MGVIFIISAPSGAGKTSIVSGVVKNDETLATSVSVTTRTPRNNENDLVDYVFVSKDRFQEMQDDGEFLEHAEVFGHRYGTLKENVENILNSGSDIVLEMDWQGALNVKKMFDNVVWLFILPPSFAELEERLTLRHKFDAGTDLEKRLEQAKSDMMFAKQADYTIINTDLMDSCQDILTIIKVERMRSNRQLGIIDAIINI